MKTIKIINKTGIHARPAGLLTKEAQKFSCDIDLIKDGKSVNAKSIMGILGMGIAEGDVIGIQANGAEADSAITSIYSIIEKINQE